MNETLDPLTLTPQRQELLAQALGGHRLNFQDGVFAADSRRSLEGVGLTPVEISALEEFNRGKSAVLIPTTRADVDKNNPWTQAGFNLTRQSEIARTDPTLAAKLKAQAGAA